LKGKYTENNVNMKAGKMEKLILDEIKIGKYTTMANKYRKYGKRNIYSLFFRNVISQQEPIFALVMCSDVGFFCFYRS
jgi:hypothetical protein